MVEYVLLLVIAVGLAAMLTKNLVSRNRDDAGVLVTKWDAILKSIGNDVPDKHQ